MTAVTDGLYYKWQTQDKKIRSTFNFKTQELETLKTYRVIRVFGEKLHFQHLFLLSGSTQESRQEEQSFQELQ